MNEHVVELIFACLFLMLQIYNRHQIKKEITKKTDEIVNQTKEQTEELTRVVESLRPQANIEEIEEMVMNKPPTFISDEDDTPKPKNKKK